MQCLVCLKPVYYNTRDGLCHFHILEKRKAQERLKDVSREIDKEKEKLRIQCRELSNKLGREIEYDTYIIHEWFGRRLNRLYERADECINKIRQ